MYKVFAGQRPPVDLDAMPEGFRNLLEDCWASEPSMRPSFKEILGRLRQLLSEERQRRFQARQVICRTAVQKPGHSGCRSTYSE